QIRSCRSIHAAQERRKGGLALRMKFTICETDPACWIAMASDEAAVPQTFADDNAHAILNIKGEQQCRH
ncbi:MAG: hypothetical protein ACK47C_03660, partial [Paracoccaceae bacterium]